MKVGIITIHYGINYGSALQAYALSKFLNENGFDAEVINFIPKRYRITPYFFSARRNHFLRILLIIARAPRLFLRRKVFSDFLKKNIPLSKLYKTAVELYNENFKYDVFITGSDQVWNKDYNGETQDIYYLKFVSRDTVKISCSASFGKSDITEQKELIEINEALKGFKAISVREDTGLKILYKAGIKDAVHILDPTFLYNINSWNKQFTFKRRLIKEPYILIYALDGEEEKLINYSKLIARKKGYKIVLISIESRKRNRNKVDYFFYNKSPEYFIELFCKADYIVTNSFHGVAFSINFEKQFIAVSRKDYNSRLESLLNMFDLNHRLIDRTSNLDINTAMEEIDYSRIHYLIEEQRNRLRNFLISNLKN